MISSLHTSWLVDSSGPSILLPAAVLTPSAHGDDFVSAPYSSETCCSVYKGIPMLISVHAAVGVGTSWESSPSGAEGGCGDFSFSGAMSFSVGIGHTNY